eukprot:Blabericola_migrator_1__7482@NODE_381_length_9180_cov_88_545814_g304_i0_p5_GENE_NODE_381_length_9180_cov_88_545814_g304_i0NODE_381_length_9180_cov_88_545814_g304_i0_p5_ORF_typecomplete_len186_score14_33YoeB_toxin/PF06769_14/0_27_NODE_381_length_9180_cov_88_545814_g304_i058006357
MSPLQGPEVDAGGLRLLWQAGTNSSLLPEPLVEEPESKTLSKWKSWFDSIPFNVWDSETRLRSWRWLFVLIYGTALVSMACISFSWQQYSLILFEGKAYEWLCSPNEIRARPAFGVAACDLQVNFHKSILLHTSSEQTHWRSIQSRDDRSGYQWSRRWPFSGSPRPASLCHLWSRTVSCEHRVVG